MAVTTLAQLFLHAAGHRKPDAMLHKVGGTFHPIATAELVDRVRRLARGLEKRGVERGDRASRYGSPRTARCCRAAPTP